MKKSILTSVFGLLCVLCQAQTMTIQRVEPVSWFVDMQNPEVELLVYGKGIGNAKVSLRYKGVKIVKTAKVANENYLFVTLNIAKNTEAGNVPLVIRLGENKTIYNYPLQKKNVQGAQTLTPADLVYLIMPDRFANGNPENDNIATAKEPTSDRKGLKTRHGGDLQGITNNLDYLTKLGVTALWLNPVQANDQPSESYHGYAFTDHYAIDPRLGSNADYQNLIDKCHEKGMKVIMDYVHNHTGNEHFFIKDLPSPDWIHQTDTFVRTTYRTSTLLDPHAAASDRNQFANGWFDKHMPDLNQQNLHVANYLIQNNLWWAAKTGIDAYRVDTYSYPDMAFMSRFAQTMHDEFPTMSIFGEVWVDFVPTQAAFTKNNNLLPNYNSNLGGVTDFNLYYAMTKALNQNFGWDTGLMQIYQSLAQDFMYENADRNVVFLDNHDLSRYLSVVNEDVKKLKMAMAFLLTTRGVPQIYYGTEVLMKNYSNPDALVREDFLGGWKTDSANLFLESGRSKAQNEMYDYIATIAQWRKTNDAIKNGALMQFVPQNGVYVYFRYHKNSSVMVVMNQNETEISLDKNRFSERLNGYKNAKNIVSKASFGLQNEQIKVAGMTTSIFELN